jgi:hypothetical protein
VGHHHVVAAFVAPVAFLHIGLDVGAIAIIDCDV